MDIRLVDFAGDEIDWTKVEITDHGRRPAPPLRFYSHDAVIPDGAWRALTDEEIGRFSCARAEYRANVDLAYFRVPPQVIDESIRRIAEFMQCRKRPVRFSKPDIDRFGLNGAIDYCRLLVPDAEPWGDWGIKCDAPGLETTTINPATGEFVGLHIDSYTLSEASKRTSHVRFVVNLGPGHRYLLFGFRAGLMPGAREHTGEAWQRFKTAALSEPGTPIGRLLLMPGEGYAANTEATVHDASSLGATAACSSLHIRCNLRDQLSRTIPRSDMAVTAGD